jgi:tetratricopeptide (TPR) repeat protein
MLASSAETMERATRGVEPLRDDLPLLEYASRKLGADRRLPADLFSVADAERFCPRCFDGGLAPAELGELEGALEVIAAYYRSAAFLEHQPGQRLRFDPALGEAGRRAVLQSLYLEQLVNSAPPDQVKAALYLRHGDASSAAQVLEGLVRRRPEHVGARVDLADLYSELGLPERAREELEAARTRAPDDRRVVAAWRELEARAPAGAP